MSSIAERLGTKEFEIKLGNSFMKDRNTYFHTFRYDFKPASVDPKKMASVEIGEGHQVTVTVPHVDKGSGTTHTVFKGSKKPYQKECVIIIDHGTGEAKLEKLDGNVQLKKFRAEGSSRIKPSPMENNVPPGSKKSPLQRLSPQQKSLWSSNHYSPVPSCSPLPKSPNSQSSPPSQTCSSVPSLVPPPPPPSNSNTADTRHFSQVPSQDSVNASFSITDNDIEMHFPDVGSLSSSGESSGDSSESSPSSSESSDEEGETLNKMPDKPQCSEYSSSKLLPNGSTNSSKQVKLDSQPAATLLLPNMPPLSQLTQDLHLSESDSDD